MSTPAQSSTPKRILVVEDNATNMMLLLRTLTQAGYEPVQALWPSRALDILAQEPIDLVITDIMMPEMNGIELVRKIRQTPSLRHLPVLMCTAAYDSELVKKAARLGVQGYVLKPIDRKLLLSRVAAILGEEHDQENEETPAAASTSPPRQAEGLSPRQDNSPERGEGSPLEQLRFWWKKASPEEQQAFLAEIAPSAGTKEQHS